jgi:hypothetical protein
MRYGGKRAEQPRLECAASNLLKRLADAVASKQGDRRSQKFWPGTVGAGGHCFPLDIALALSATTFAAGDLKYKNSCFGIPPFARAISRGNMLWKLKFHFAFNHFRPLLLVLFTFSRPRSVIRGKCMVMLCCQQSTLARVRMTNSGPEETPAKTRDRSCWFA